FKARAATRTKKLALRRTCEGCSRRSTQKPHPSTSLRIWRGEWRCHERAIDHVARLLASRMARPEGLEPPAYRFEACRSIQLSYGRVASLYPASLRSCGELQPGDKSYG